MASDKIVNLSNENFNEGVAKGTVLVDFWAPWCGPCRMVGPILEEIASKRDDIKIVKVDVDDAGDKAAEFGIRSIPCLVMMKDGKEVDRRVGAMSKSQIEVWLSEQTKAEIPSVPAVKEEKKYPVFENPGVKDGILKKDDKYIVFMLVGETNETKQVDVCSSLENAFKSYSSANLVENGILVDLPPPSVFELREVKEMKLFKIQ